MDISFTDKSSSSYEKFNHDLEQEQLLKKTPQGAETGRGANLTADSLETPLEVIMSVHSQETDSNQPSLVPLARTAFEEESQKTDPSRDYYLQRRESLPPMLKHKLNEDEKQPLGVRDPDLLALDVSLHQEADLVTFANQLALLKVPPEQLSAHTQQEYTLLNLVQQETRALGVQTLQTLERYVGLLGMDESSREALYQVSNQLKESITLLTSIEHFKKSEKE